MPSLPSPPEIAELEGGVGAVCYSTGMAATCSVMSSFLKMGDHAIVTDCSCVPPHDPRAHATARRPPARSPPVSPACSEMDRVASTARARHTRAHAPRARASATREHGDRVARSQLARCSPSPPPCSATALFATTGTAARTASAGCSSRATASPSPSSTSATRRSDDKLSNVINLRRAGRRAESERSRVAPGSGLLLFTLFSAPLSR